MGKIMRNIVFAATQYEITARHQTTRYEQPRHKQKLTEQLTKKDHQASDAKLAGSFPINDR